MAETINDGQPGWYRLEIDFFGSFAVRANDEDHAWDRLRSYGKHVNGVLNLDPDVLPTMKRAHFLNGEGGHYDRLPQFSSVDDPEGFTLGVVQLSIERLLPKLPTVTYGAVPQARPVEEQLAFDPTHFERWPS